MGKYVAAAPSLSFGKRLRAAPEWKQVIFPWVTEPRQVVGTRNGRSAMWLALHELEAGEILLPAFNCPTVPATASGTSVSTSYYDVDTAGEPVVDQIADGLSRDGAKAVVVLHYCGFPNRALAEIVEIAERCGAIVLEDCAHSALSSDGKKPLGSTGYASIFSLRKSFAVPDGGALVINGDAPDMELPSKGPSSLSTAAHLAYLLAGSIEAKIGWSPRTRIVSSKRVKDALETRDADAAASVDGSGGLSMSKTSMAILARQTPDQVVRKRRENFSYLLERLSEISWLRAMFRKLPDGVCPFGFPVLCEGRDDARAYLLRHGINVRAYWDATPEGITEDQFPGAFRLASQVLVLPTHQSISKLHLDYVVDKLLAYRS